MTQIFFLIFDVTSSKFREFRFISVDNTKSIHTNKSQKQLKNKRQRGALEFWCHHNLQANIELEVKFASLLTHWRGLHSPSATF